jgi:membrane protease YdiL (CAAX protease family)
MRRVGLALRGRALAAWSHLAVCTLCVMAWVFPFDHQYMFLFLLLVLSVLEHRAGTISALGLAHLVGVAALTFGFTSSRGAGRGTEASLFACLLCAACVPIVFPAWDPLPREDDDRAPRPRWARRWFPGLPLLRFAQSSPESEPFSMGLEAGATTVACLLLWANACDHPHIATLHELSTIALVALFMSLGTVIILFFGTIAVLERVTIDVKWPPFLPAWLWCNLFGRILPQELLFRGVVQSQLEIYLSHDLGLLVSVAIYGLAPAVNEGWVRARWRGAAQEFFFYGLYGLFLGWAYHVTDRVEGSIFLRLAVDTIHFLLFSYPAAMNISGTGMMYTAGHKEIHED